MVQKSLVGPRRGAAKVARAGLLASTVSTAAIVFASPALAQEAYDNGLQDIVVTAQKREQSVQDVPIAVTALGGDALQANRVVSVTDLGGLAPGVTIRTSAGGSKLPSFSVRGAVSYGVVPGSDRQVSMYLDGVYIASPRGSIFDLPDMERIEMLRGPQGTLFGRNATAGAVSISTRDPDGDFGIKATGTFGNHDQRRFRLGVNIGEIGPFSGYMSYVHDEKRGDVRNLDAGVLWDRTASVLPSVAKRQRSAEWLGSKNTDSWFAALKFESGDFKTVYKYDRTEDESTAEATAVTAFIPSAIIIPGIAPFMTAMFESNNVGIAANAKRPKAVNNGWVVPATQKVQGHSVTSTYQISDELSVKNLFAFRKSFIFNTSALDGFAGLPDYGRGSPIVWIAIVYGRSAFFVGLGIQTTSRSEQISDEFQVNYDSDFLTATAGALWFQGKDWTNEHMLQNTLVLSIPFNGVLQNTGIGFTYNKAISLAAYTQLEFHVTPQLDVVLGGRITKDKKSGNLRTGPDLNSLQDIAFTYKKTKPSYLVGVNYKPTDDILVYGKFSTAFVSGGSVGGVPFDPETAKSWEGGVKADLFDRKLRTSLALYHASYKNYQTAQAATNFIEYITDVTGDPNRWSALGTIVVPSGGVKAKGFEFDLTAAPAEGLTLGGNLGYSKVTYNNINPVISASNGGRYEPSSFRPEWTGGLWGQYQTQPLIGDAYMSFRVDGIWQSDMGLAQNPDLPLYTANPNMLEVPSYWLINSRVALQDLDIRGIKAQVAAWGKNLTDEKAGMFIGDYTKFVGTGVLNFIPARSYGVDLTIEF